MNNRNKQTQQWFNQKVIIDDFVENIEWDDITGEPIFPLDHVFYLCPTQLRPVIRPWFQRTFLFSDLNLEKQRMSYVLEEGLFCRLFWDFMAKEAIFTDFS